MKNLVDNIDWEKLNGLVPAIIQNYKTGQVLMLGYMNIEALNKTLNTQKVWFWSRLRKCLWMKGETSGNTLNLIDIKLDCDCDTLLVQVIPDGVTCHTGDVSCFGNDSNINFLAELFALVEDRKKKMPVDSYTSTLFEEGLDKICAKIDEESAEVVQAAKYETKQRLIEESVDLTYHLFVLLVNQDVSFLSLLDEFKNRNS